jgi:CheY-like chemotaxis protein
MTFRLQSIPFPLFPMPSDSRWIPGSPSPGSKDWQSHDKAQRPRILVLDDEIVIAETVVEILRHAGFDAIVVTNGAAAVEKAGEWLPQVVLSDVVMPGMNGIETGIQIRERVPDCKVILFSGQAATLDMLEKARLQGYDFQILAKPIKPEQLIAAIRFALISEP